MCQATRASLGAWLELDPASVILQLRTGWVGRAGEEGFRGFDVGRGWVRERRGGCWAEVVEGAGDGDESADARETVQMVG